VAPGYAGAYIPLVVAGGSPGSASTLSTGTPPPVAFGGTAATGNTPSAIAFAVPYDGANGCTTYPTYAYITNSGSNLITTYSLTANGITAVSSATTGAGPSSLATYNYGSSNAAGLYSDVYYLYAANAGDGTISEYTVSCPVARLLPIAGIAPVTAGPGLNAIATLSFSSLMSATYAGPLTYLYADVSAGVSAFPIATTTGLLGAPVGGPVAFGTAAGPLTTYNTSASRVANVAASSQTVTVVPPTGLGAPLVVSGAYLVDAQGVFPQGTTVQSVSADQTTITLSAAPTASVASDTLYFVSAFVYVADLKTSTITTMIANPFTGQLTAIGTPLGVGQTPTAIRVTTRPFLGPS
jgi:hypothetical protein